MSLKFDVGDTAYVPRARLELPQDGASALVSTTVVARNGRKISVQHPDLAQAVALGSSAAHNSSGVFIVSIGDYKTEEHVLDPLTKSILHYFRLLLDPGSTKGIFVRSLAELTSFWSREHVLYSHVVLVGHGRTNAVKFAVDGWVAADDLASTFAGVGSDPKNFLSLCCRTGSGSFGTSFSSSDGCNAFIAPDHDIHAAAASQFCQTFFTIHFLEGRTLRVAFNQTRDRLPVTSKFRMWRWGVEIGAA